jgi:hypothetical protein
MVSYKFSIGQVVELNPAISRMSRAFAKLYARDGRPSVASCPAFCAFAGLTPHPSAIAMDMRRLLGQTVEAAPRPPKASPEMSVTTHAGR